MEMHKDGPKDVVIVTGSSGLIGRAVVDRLLGRYRVVGFDRGGDPFSPPGAECVCVDVTSDESVQRAMERVREVYGERLASVVHLAAYYDFSGEPSPKYEEVTVRGTERLLQTLQDFHVEQFIFSSTMLVHKPCQPGERINEDWPLEPKWDYPKSKVHTEKVILDERGGIPVVIQRIAGVYTDRCRSIPLAHQIQRIYERWLTSHLFPGDTSHGQAFVHLDDAVGAVLAAIECRNQLPPETVVLIGEEQTLSYDELQRAFGRLIHGEEWETREIPKAVAKAGVWIEDALPLGEEPFIKPWMVDLADDHYALDITRARQLLGWQPHRSLRQTLPAMVAALKRDPLRWYEENKLHPPADLTRHPAESSSAATESEPEERAAHAGPRAVREAGAKSGPHGETADEEMPGHATDKVPSANGHGAGHHTEEAADHTRMMRQMRRSWLWTNFTVITAGLWLMSSPFTFGYHSSAMTWSDVFSGGALVLLGALSLSPRWDFVGRWGAALVGLWLQFAPLIFWAPTAVAYVTDTLIGALVIGLTILVPMMPGMAHHMEMIKPGPETPPGWSYNPSSWLQRAPLIATGFLGWFISRYLAAVQLGYIDGAWEPFFGAGTQQVLHSRMSQMWPISDAGLGALAYTIEALMGWMGGTARWRTMPWMVTFFGVLVIPLGLTHIILVISQPVAVGVWCTLCLAAAAVMLLMIPLTVDEVVAMVQFMQRSVREGKPFWRTFWVGGTLDEVNKDTRSPDYGAPLASMVPAMVWGVTVPWNLVVSAALGLWMMFAPSVLGMAGTTADSAHVAGALALTVSVIAMAEVVRTGRYLNVLLGLWVAAAPWLLAGGTTATRTNGVIVGLALALVSLTRGAVRERYDGWDRYTV
jgi:nucleoside-diphosphate-sugar epimerase